MSLIIIYPAELQLNKANTSSIGSSFLDLNIWKLNIGNNIHTSVYDKRDYFGSPIVNILWLSGDVHDSHRSVLVFCSWFDLLDVVLMFFILIIKIFKSLQNYWHRETSLGKRLGSFFKVILGTSVQIWHYMFQRNHLLGLVM